MIRCKTPRWQCPNFGLLIKADRKERTYDILCFGCLFLFFWCFGSLRNKPTIFNKPAWGASHCFLHLGGERSAQLRRDVLLAVSSAEVTPTEKTSVKNTHHQRGGSWERVHFWRNSSHTKANGREKQSDFVEVFMNKWGGSNCAFLFNRDDLKIRQNFQACDRKTRSPPIYMQYKHFCVYSCFFCWKHGAVASSGLVIAFEFCAVSRFWDRHQPSQRALTLLEKNWRSRPCNHYISHYKASWNISIREMLQYIGCWGFMYSRAVTYVISMIWFCLNMFACVDCSLYFAALHLHHVQRIQCERGPWPWWCDYFLGQTPKSFTYDTRYDIDDI